MFDVDKYKMPRIERLMASEEFNDILDKIECLEKSRIYCPHNLGHLLDVARMMYIINLEENLGIDKEVIYAAALTHDLGRLEEYSGGRDHHLASCDIAINMMKKSGFDQKQIDDVVIAISKHRSDSNTDEANYLAGLLRFADKRSRNCYRCSARDTCKWSDEKKNSSIFT